MVERSQEDAALAEALGSAGLPQGGIRILQSALRLFARKGYAATTVREIVQDAQATNPMLYYYFESKEGVFLKLIDLLFGVMDQRIFEVVENTELAFEDKLRNLIEVHLKGLHDSPMILGFVYSAIFAPPECQPNIQIFVRREAVTQAVTKLFQDAMDAGILRVRSTGITPVRLTSLFLGTINQHLMFSLKMLEDNFEPYEDEFAVAGDEVVESLLMFFFYGATGSTAEVSNNAQQT